VIDISRQAVSSRLAMIEDRLRRPIEAPVAIETAPRLDQIEILTPLGDGSFVGH